MNRRRFANAAAATGAAAAIATALPLFTPATLAAQESGNTASASTPVPVAKPDVNFRPGVIETLLGEVQLPANPQKVICINDGPVDTMLNLGLTPTAIGYSYGDSNGVMDYLKPFAAGEIEYIGDWDSFDIERAIAIQPDLILAEGRGRFTESTREGAEADPMVQNLMRIAPLVIPMDVDTSDPLGTQYFEYSHLVWSHCLGKLAEGEALLDAQREKTAQLKADLTAHRGETSIVFRPTPEFPLVMAQTWFTGVLLNRVGIVGNDYANSVAYPHSGKSLSLENMNKLDADWIFVAPRFSAEAADDRIAVLDEYFNNPLFSSLPSVATGQYGVVDGQVWSGANSMIAADLILDDIRGVIVDGVQDQIADAE